MSEPITMEVTLPIDGTTYNVPLRSRITGYDFEAVADLIHALNLETLAATTKEVPHFKKLMAIGDRDESNKYATEHITDIMGDMDKLTTMFNQARNGTDQVEVKRISTRYDYLLCRMALEVSGLPADVAALVHGEPDSEFWQQQDLREVRAIGSEFRTACGL